MIETKGFSFSPGTGARFVEATPVPLRFVDGKTLVPDSGVEILAKGAAQAAENLLAGVKIGVSGIESGVKSGVDAYVERLKAKEHNDLLREMYGDRNELAQAKLALQERQLADREAGIIGGRSGSGKTPLDYSEYGLNDGVSSPIVASGEETSAVPALNSVQVGITPPPSSKGDSSAETPPLVDSENSARPPNAEASAAPLATASTAPLFNFSGTNFSPLQEAASPGLDMAQTMQIVGQPMQVPKLDFPATKDLQEARLRLMGAGYDEPLPGLVQVAAPSEIPAAAQLPAAPPLAEVPATADQPPQAAPQPTPAAMPQAPVRQAVNSPFIKVPIAGPDGKASGYVLFDRVSRKLIPASHILPTDDPSSVNPPEGWQPRTMTINGDGKASRTFLSPEEVQKEKDQHAAADDLHQANLGIKKEKLAQVQRDGYTKDVSVKTYVGPNGAQQALAAFVPAFNEANDPHNTSKSSSEMSMLDQLVRAETGGKPTETQIHTIRSNMPLKEKIATLFGKNYEGDFLGKNMYESLAQQIVGNAANKAKIANGTIEGIRQSYIEQGLEPPKQLKPFVVPMTVKDVNDELVKLKGETVPLAQQYDELQRSGRGSTDAAKQIRSQLEEHQAQAVKLANMKSKAKHFIVNLDEFLDTSNQGWKGVAIEALSPQSPSQ